MGSFRRKIFGAMMSKDLFDLLSSSAMPMIELFGLLFQLRHFFKKSCSSGPQAPKEEAVWWVCRGVCPCFWWLVQSFAAAWRSTLHPKDWDLNLRRSKPLAVAQWTSPKAPFFLHQRLLGPSQKRSAEADNFFDCSKVGAIWSVLVFEKREGCFRMWEWGNPLPLLKITPRLKETRPVFFNGAGGFF